LCDNRLSLCRHLVLSIHPAPDAIVVFFQVSVSLLALSSYISTPSASLEGSRKSISDITTTRKNLTPPTTKVPDNTTLSSKTSSSFQQKKKHRQSFSLTQKHYKDISSQVRGSFVTPLSFSLPTRLFSNNTSLNTTSKNQHLTK
jgi:hypothetical protein